MDDLPENIGYHLSIDETSLLNGELYTILIIKPVRERKMQLEIWLKEPVVKK
ncbi:MAG: hypothetical protein IMY72_01745 [Bacteroidetes bacterium]|nr:hypothetical protein [Bacteroidota bacterium]